MKSAFRRCAADMWRRRQEQQQTHNRRNHQGTGGFTLVELIVTLVVLGVLLTVGVMSLRGWQDYAEFKRENEFAQDLFSAAQIQLTQYAERGQLTELTNAVTGDGKAGTSEYLLKDSGLTGDTGSGSPSWQDGQAGNVYFLKVKKGDYITYRDSLKMLPAEDMRSKDIEERRIRALYDLIDPYIADKSMLDAAICIEFDPNPRVALVYSVFYNDKVEEFTYGAISDGDSDKASLDDRRADERKKKKTGYYGAEMLSMGTDPNITRPVITNLRLNNEDTLNLTWSVKDNSDKALTRLIYNISLMEPSADPSQKGTNLLTIRLNTVGKDSLDDLIVNNQVTCDVTDAAGASKEYRFPLIHNVSDNTLTLVLDGLDLSADETQPEEIMAETASICRFGLNTDAIYAAISASRPGAYDVTIEKRSNTENPLFGEKKTLEDGSVSCLIENARHLNNIRYGEQDHAAEQTVRYQLTKDISWEYVLNQGTVYSSGVVQQPEHGDVSGYYFKPLTKLGSASYLESDDASRPRTLRKFRMAVDHMGFAGEEYAMAPIGLVSVNEGTIQHLTLEDVSVNGIAQSGDQTVFAMAAGAFCGSNQGQLSGLTVRDSGTVEAARKQLYNEITGLEFVGGIAGLTMPEAGSVSYEKLVNRIAVTGQHYVGGIVGGLEVSGEDSSARITACENYGKVRGKKYIAAGSSYFVGGIIGAGMSDSGEKIVVENCISFPYYSEDELFGSDADISDTDAIAALVENQVADYVGGIIGYSDGVQIIESGTVRESSEQEGYVLGRDYVGGIAGFHAGGTSGLTAGTRNGRNQANVVGRKYVGGVVGCNAVGKLIYDQASDYYTVELAVNPAENSRIQGWINEGMVVSTGDYAGGITGYNGVTGIIDSCYSSMEYTNASQKLQSVSGKARFVGGVAGYNGGEIYSRSGEEVYVTSAISGKDYIGGVVGLNDTNGSISNYVLRGGTVKGSHFVGGFTGLNMSEKMFDTAVKANPNTVTGDYFVGGIIGANMIPASDGQTIDAAMGTNNFLGNINAENGAYAGGFIGYNCLLKAGVTQDTLLKTTDELCESLVAFPEGTGRVTDPSGTVSGALDELINSSAEMKIHDSEQTADTGQGLLGGIKGRVYVGGIVGENHAKSKLTIQNVENITPVEATGYITRKEGNIPLEHNYSFAGGIIGLVQDNVTLDRCRNSETGEVKTAGTYHGGLVEVNYGSVINCETGSIGDGSSDYVGGLVGVNASKTSAGSTVKGKIRNCVINGNISGSSFVGGLAAENFGIIEYNEETAAGTAEVSGSGFYVGGITGYAHAGGEIRMSSRVDLDVNISGDACYVGGIAGVNEGTIKTSLVNGLENSADNTITGRRHVGGFIGAQIVPTQNSESELSGMRNYAHVQATGGYAGGIVAIVAGKQGENQFNKVVIEDCENHGIVEVLQEDTEPLEEEPEGGLGEISEQINNIVEEEEATAAGGITAINRCVIRGSGNYGEINAGDGYLGGIAAVNYHKITNSESGSAIAASDTLTLVGTTYVGGISAVNKPDATIEDCSVKNLILNNQSDSTSGYMGGAVAWNQGKIRNCQVGVDYEARDEKKNENTDADQYESFRREAAGYVAENAARESLLSGSTTEGMSVALISFGTDVTMGGVAGLNDGTIKGGKGTDARYSVVAAELGFRENSINYFGNLGGIAGVNGGTISNYEFSGFVMGHANDPAKTPVFDAANDLEQGSARIYGIGGIAGMNGSDLQSASATIEDCALGVAKIHGTGAGSNNAIVGGVTGFNGIGTTIDGVMFREKSALLDAGADAPFTYTKYGNNDYKGTVWVAVDTLGFAGGAAGYNHGEITRINWNEYEAVRNLPDTAPNGYFSNGVYASDKLTPVDDSYALITSGTGNTGGIVGYNRRTGSITKVVTGRNWLVHTNGQEQNSGTGGIIGYNISERDLEHCDNHATVAKTTTTGNGVGGMTGRNENATTSSWRFYDCRNYGTIVAAARGGGMIGNWKYKGGTLEACRNYGILQSNKEGNGGMVGYVYGVLDGETLNLIQCENHGAIKGGTPAGGMIGGTDTVKINCYISGCVNTGMITGSGSEAGGIIGKVGYTNGMHITGCRNYGYSASGSQEFSGITSAKVDVTDCIGVTGAKVSNPISSNTDTASGNYYFSSADSAVVPTDFWVSEMVAEGAAENHGSLGLVITGAELRGNFYFKKENQTPNSIIFRFSVPVYLNELELKLAPESDGRKASYDITFYSGDGTSIKSVSEQDRTVSASYDLEGERVASVSINNYKMIDKNDKVDNALIYQFIAKGSTSVGGDETQNKIMSSKPVIVNTGATTTYKVKDNAGDGVLWIQASRTPHYVTDVYGVTRIREVADYVQTDILNEKRESDAAVSYQLCKGTTRDGAVVKGLDEYLIITREDMTELGMPKNLASKAVNGSYQITWDQVEHVEYYKILCTYHFPNASDNGAPQDKVVTYVSYATNLTIPTEVESEGVPANSVTVSIQAWKGTLISPSSDSLEVIFEAILPTPQVAWRLDGLEESGQYRVELLNQADYVAFIEQNLMGTLDPDTQEGKEKIAAELTNIQINVTGLASVTFTAADAAMRNTDGSYKLYNSGNFSNKMITAQASYGASVRDSVLTTRQSTYPMRSNYVQSGYPPATKDRFARVELEKTASNSGIGFSGTTLNSLTYQVSLKRSADSDDSPVADFRAELMATDPDLGVPVAFSISEQTRISSTNNAATIVKLGNLPDDFLTKDTRTGILGAKTETYRYQNVMVRTYPTKMQGDIVYQGWDLSGENVYTGEELEDLSVSDNGVLYDAANDQKGEKLFTGSGSRKTLKPGYVLVWAGRNAENQSVYKLYYNTLLRELLTDKDYTEEEASTLDAWKNNNKTFMRYQVFYHFIDLDQEIASTQPVPVVYANAVYDAGKQTWGNGDYDGSDRFVLTWDQAASGNNPAYTGDAAETLYTNAVYQLTISGVTGESTTVLVNGEQFTTTARTDGTSYNTYTADPARVKTWNYDKLIVSLTRLGTVNSSGITQKFPSTVLAELPMRKRLSQVLNVTTAPKKDSFGVALKDNLEYVVSFTGVPEAEKTALEKYRITVASRETVNPSTSVTSEVTDSDATSAEIDLKTFRRGEKIMITVQAIAKADGAADHTGYRDGLVSPQRDMTVPERLRKPQMGKPTADASENNMTAQDLKESLSVAEFAGGAITLNMKKENYTDVNLEYRIALELYESKEAAQAGESPITGTSLPTKEAYGKMTHSTINDDYTYVLKGLSTDYAGGWLKVVLQSANSSSISSVWTDVTDEGNPDDVAEPYLLFQLPKVQVDAVEITRADSEQVEYPICQDGKPVEPAGSLNAWQYQAEFDLVGHADQYKINLIQLPQAADQFAANSNEYKVSNISEMTLTKQSDTSYEFTYWGTEGADAGAKKETKGTVTVDGKPLELPYHKAVRLSETETHYIETKADITLTKQSDNDPIHVVLRLPDCKDVTDSVNESLGAQIFTEQLLIQSIAKQPADATQENPYLDSRWSMLVQDEDGDSEHYMIEQAEQVEEPTDLDLEASEAAGINDVVYTAGLKGKNRYIVSVKDGGGTDLGTFAVPVFQASAIDQIRQQQIWFPKGFADYAEKTLRVSFQSIYDASSVSGGLSSQKTTDYEIMLPELQTRMAAQVQSGLADSKPYQVTLQDETGISLFGLILGKRTASTAVITARQKQLTWDYDLQDTAVVGYTMALEGSGLDSAYKLELDLHRGLFGGFPGLSDYMTEQGKTLYQVDYRVDGDMLLKLDGFQATPSDAEPATPANMATQANTATASNSNLNLPGELVLDCTLRAEYVMDGDEISAIRFTLTLPDASYDYMPEEIAELYADGFPDGLYQTENFRLDPILINRAFRKEELVLDLTDLRGELENNLGEDNTKQ